MVNLNELESIINDSPTNPEEGTQDLPKDPQNNNKKIILLGGGVILLIIIGTIVVNQFLSPKKVTSTPIGTGTIVEEQTEDQIVGDTTSTGEIEESITTNTSADIPENYGFGYGTEGNSTGGIQTEVINSSSGINDNSISTENIDTTSSGVSENITTETISETQEEHLSPLEKMRLKMKNQ